MSAAGFTCCSQCGTKLHTTFFCHDCGQPSCCLDCYCRHQASHVRKRQTVDAEHQVEQSSNHLQPAR